MEVVGVLVSLCCVEIQTLCVFVVTYVLWS